MRTASLLCVCLLAKAAALAGRDLPLSGGALLARDLLAYIWQDLLLVLVFAGLDGLLGWLDRLGRRSSFPGRLLAWARWTAYALLVFYIAVNVPIARTLSTPLTYPMFRAAGPALADSIAHYATAANLALLASVLASGAGLPFLFRRVTPRHTAIASAVVIPLTICGIWAGRHLDTLGLHRNAIVAVVISALPQIAAAENAPAQVEPLHEQESPTELAELKGAAAGQNVVLIVLESAAAIYLRPYGAAEDPMPHLTRLASEGLLFENAYAVYPESIKGLFALLCARYPAIDTEPEQYAAIKTPSLAAVLREQGCRTALFHSGRFRYLGMESMIRNRGYDLLEDAGDIGGNHESSFGIDEPSTVRRLLGWINELPRGQRFFVTYMPVAGHHPYETHEPGPFPDDADIDRYRNAQHYADAAIGQLLTGLRERGLDERTLVVVIGDHGQAFGQHPGNFGHTLFLYEENVRVPFIIAGKGLRPSTSIARVHQPQRIGRIASHVDVAPTVLDLLGLPAPADYQGRSLLGGRDETALFFTDYSQGLVGLRDANWKDGDWKFIHEIRGQRDLLFDLSTDPAESRNLATHHPEQVTRYQDYLLRWAAAQKGLVREGR